MSSEWGLPCMLYGTDKSRRCHSCHRERPEKPAGPYPRRHGGNKAGRLEDVGRRWRRRRRWRRLLSLQPLLLVLAVILILVLVLTITAEILKLLVLLILFQLLVLTLLVLVLVLVVVSLNLPVQRMHPRAHAARHTAPRNVSHDWRLPSTRASSPIRPPKPRGSARHDLHPKTYHDRSNQLPAARTPKVGAEPEGAPRHRCRAQTAQPAERPRQKTKDDTLQHYGRPHAFGPAATAPMVSPMLSHLMRLQI